MLKAIFCQMVYITHFLKQVTKIAVEAFVKYEYMNHCKNMKKKQINIMKDITLQTIVVLSINNRFIVNQNIHYFSLRIEPQLNY